MDEAREQGRSVGVAAVRVGACRFEIEAVADIQTLPRLLDCFAQRGLLPARVHAEIDGDEVRVTIEQPALDPAQARIIAEKMRTSVLVREVRLRVAQLAG